MMARIPVDNTNSSAAGAVLFYSASTLVVHSLVVCEPVVLRKTREVRKWLQTQF